MAIHQVASLVAIGFMSYLCYRLFGSKLSKGLRWILCTILILLILQNFISIMTWLNEHVKITELIHALVRIITEAFLGAFSDFNTE